jgi:hypothetical protein
LSERPGFVTRAGKFLTTFAPERIILAAPPAALFAQLRFAPIRLFTSSG